MLIKQSTKLMEELMNNYEQVYNFKQDHSSDYAQDLSSLNNNYSVEENELDLRLWAMVREPSDELRSNLDDFPILNVGDGFFTCRAIKTSVRL